MYEKFGGEVMARLMDQRWSGHYKTTQSGETLSKDTTTLEFFYLF